MTTEVILIYLKLIYKDVETCQQLFLSKIEFIPNLKNIEFELGNRFKKTHPLTTEEISNLKNKEVQYLANFYFEYSFPEQVKNYQTKNLQQKIIENISKDQDIYHPDYYWLGAPASLSDLVKNKNPVTINKIDYYEITEEHSYIEIELKKVRKLKLHENTEFLICNSCNIETIDLNIKLKLLEANENEITEMELNKDLIEATLWENPLEYLKINENLKTVWLSHPKNHNIVIDNSINNKEVEINYNIN
jgi:hypothetical protein